MWRRLIYLSAIVIACYGVVHVSTQSNSNGTVSIDGDTSPNTTQTDTTQITVPSTTQTSVPSTTQTSITNTKSSRVTGDTISNTSATMATESTTTTTYSNTTSVKVDTTSVNSPNTSSDESETTSIIISTTNSKIITSSEALQTKLSVILPAVLVPVGVITIGAIIVLLYLRHSRRKGKGSSEKKVTSKLIDILEFENYLTDMNANSQLKFSEEFMALAQVGKEYPKEAAGLEINREKNRYTDIKPYDLSRVKLSINPEDESDYINASWITGYFSRRQYIAAQGPMPSTQDDFWRMVWEYNSRIIIMLTKTMENNRIKCCQYWPSGKEVVMYGDIAVSIIDETETDSWIVREMNVSMGQQKRLVKQCFFTKWPDMKTPEESSSIIDFIRMIRSYCPMRGSSPLVVHCSAGVGRTGAFIAIDTAMYQIEEENKVDIFGIVYKMRLNRVSMVQNERQYIFIYETVADIIRSHLNDRKTKPNGHEDYFLYDLPKHDSISDHAYTNFDTSTNTLTLNDDNKTLI